MYVPPGFATVTPYIFASDAPRYVRFLIEGLGAEEVGRSERPDGKIANCQVRIGTAMLMVSEAQGGYPPSQAALYIYVENAEAGMARAIAAGARLEMQVDDMPYGDRQGGIVDPSGNIWWISQRVAEEPYF